MARLSIGLRTSRSGSSRPERGRKLHTITAGPAPLREKSMRRVVVTGMGIVSSIGNSTQDVTASLREAKSGIRRAEDYAELGFRCQVHGAPDINVEELVDRRAMRFHG